MAPDSSPDDTLGNSLIPIVNKLQDIFAQVTVDLKLDLPQVAVVGSQSSGKSSVLEALVGRDFLPRGNDIVTRRPLLLQLIKTSLGPTGRPAEWGEFLHAPGKMFYDFDRIRQEIQQETERLVGANKNVSDKPIRLKIFSPRVLTMTLVDLPGLTRIPVGDQPGDIEARIREMALDYIRRPNCVILAVSPANVDLATSDALQLAQVADPEGVRTIGVLTKLDIMDRGTDAAHILRNTHIPLRLGYIGVVLRAQADIVAGLPMPECRKREEAFFASHAEYRDVAAHCGVGNLARRLNTILVEHIRGLLPGLRRRIHEALEVRLAELRTLGDPEPVQSRNAKGAYLLQLLCDYAERYAAMLDGRHLDLNMAQQLSGGARVRAVFTEQFLPALTRLDPARDLTDAEVSTVIRNGAGVSGSLMVPQEPFELLARRAVQQLMAPSLSCKDRVHEELVRIAEAACPPETARFPQLQRHLAHAVVDFIRSGAAPAEAMIRSLVECECDYINCDHPDFIGGRGAIRAVLQDRAARQAASSGQRKEATEGTGPTSSGASASAVSGILPRKAMTALENGTRLPTPAIGLKGLPDHGSSLDDMFLPTVSRRRRSESESDIAAVTAMGSTAPSGAGGTLASGWFSWLLRDRPETGIGMNASAAGSVSGMAGGLAGSGGSSGLVMGMGRGGDDGLAVAAAAAGGSLGPLPSLLARQLAGGSGRSRLTDSEAAEVEVVRRLVESYFAISRKNLSDLVPKTIMHFMVHYTKRGLQQHLIKALYRDDLLDALLTEADDVVARRSAAKEAVGVLRAAVSALEEVPNEMLMGAGGHGASNGTVAPSSSGTASVNPFTAAVAAADAAAAASAHSEGLGGYLSASSVGMMGTGSAASSLPPVPYSSGLGSIGSPGYVNDSGSVDRSMSMVVAANMASVATTQLQPTTFRTLEAL
ncbi:hypothetical protein Vretimale_710 [Volvox reticuliferus]|uniref:Uncharacterized protein n=1 Tax=Volvox reticuliferus TaxID=1737510 RepID=A0A8J4D9I3_9CHLO|nr:hypothetical protein Vretifemale_2125 [Volvox reticuliferus]GIL94741.1 hypothetical protein Vretimale_710 [Volvox reticuliferus]